MIKNPNSIQLFKRNRETDGRIQQPLKKEDSPNSEQQVPELIIRPFEFKDNEISLTTNSDQSFLSSGITKVIRKGLGLLPLEQKDKSLLDSLIDKNNVQKWPIWSIFKKLQ